MPDHYHLLAKIIQSDCLSKYLGDVENGFSRYFNLTHHRHGPLWQSRFKAVRIKTNEQLLHVSRYIHLNPTTAQLVLLPQDWAGSSYCDFINHPQALRNWVTDISIYQPADYKRFVEDNQSHQLKLKSIKNVLFD
ncbi:MAG: transposase [Patescibacteria group bacterium]|nr:transposase [Patescibacteria group bacterium]